MTYIKQHLMPVLDAMKAPAISEKSIGRVLGRMPQDALALLAADIAAASELSHPSVPAIASVLLDADLLAKLPKDRLAQFVREMATHMADEPKGVQQVADVIAHAIHTRFRVNAARAERIAERARFVRGG